MIPRLIATVLHVGFLRPAPGTWGSLAALPLAWGLHTLGGFALLAVATALLFVAGLWATRELTQSGPHDPPEIVVDEVVGQWIALWSLSLPATLYGIDILAMWPGWISAFVLFRLFDIWKPGPVGWADRQDGAWGVMLDDVIAGVFAAIGTIALAALAHGVLL